MAGVSVDWNELESELELAVWDAIAGGPASESTAKTVRRVVDARTRRWFGRIPGLKKVDVRAHPQRNTIVVEIDIHVGDRVRTVRTRVQGH